MLAGPTKYPLVWNMLELDQTRTRRETVAIKKVQKPFGCSGDIFSPVAFSTAALPAHSFLTLSSRELFLYVLEDFINY